MAVVGHALTGCVSLSQLLKSTHNFHYSDLGFDKLDHEMDEGAEIQTKAYGERLSFDELRLKSYTHTRVKQLIRLLCSSNKIQQNIKLAYYQVRL